MILDSLWLLGGDWTSGRHTRFKV